MKKTDVVFMGLHSVVLTAIMCITLVNQGGFFEGAIVLAGLLMSVFSFDKTFKLKIGLSEVVFFCFSVWYFICAIKNGFVTDYFIKGLMPFVVLMSMIYVNNAGDSKEKVLEYIIKFSVVIALIAIVRTSLLCISTGSPERLLFPFNYSNAAGVYYGVCYFLCDGYKEKLLPWVKYVFLIALLMSQSVGAAILFVLFQGYVFLEEKKLKKLGIMISFVAGFGILLYERVVESSATFLERLLQLHDGIFCIMKNPLWGIGSGRWETAKELYQTGFYSATELHGSIVAVGVSSGLIGLALFTAFVVLKIKSLSYDKKKLLPILMFLAHSAVDFTLSFSFICFFMALLSKGEEMEFEGGKLAKYVGVSVAFSIMLFSALGQYYVANVGDFENNFFATHSVKTSKRFVSFAMENGIKIDDNVFNNLGHMPTEIIIYKYYLNGGGEYLLNALKERPYNSTLREFIEENCSEEYVNSADEIYKTAIDSMSPLGKKLYELKGENL